MLDSDRPAYAGGRARKHSAASSISRRWASEHQLDHHAGRAELPPGGYLYEDQRWLVGHASTEWGTEPETVIIEARRHILDFGDFTDVEAATFGELLRRLYPAIKDATGAERVYLVSTMAVMPHFHAWLVPWMAGS